ncbi:MAG: MurR/RpiR family transcriptional regulator [Oscillospiraceae bacterium]|jgi:DNA-binding MurR/RpiR family transcriptional regulator|nr:MurR/RpiR family transcriptional regulator [Oscillospiraceae bacterium]
MPEINAFEKISSAYYSLTAAEKKVADYVIIHQQESQYMSISELAEACGVAEATISRFARRLNYKGYNAFKLAVAHSTAGRSAGNPLSGQVLAEDGVSDVCQKLFAANVDAMEQTLSLLRPEDVTAAGDLLERADKVLCMGQGGSMVMAQEAAHLFSTAFGKYFAVTDSHMQAIAATQLGPRDVILYFSYSGATRDMVENCLLARERGAKVILVTRFPKSPGAALASVVLQCGANENPLQMGSVAARIAMIFVLDVLFSEVCRRDLPACRARRRQVADALSEKHL